MYALLSNPQSNLPTIVSTHSLDYPTMLQAGWVQLMTGFKKELERVEEQLMVEFTESLELNNELN